MAYAAPTPQYFNASNGAVNNGTINIANADGAIIVCIEPSVALLVLNVKLPPGPFDGQVVRFTTTQGLALVNMMDGAGLALLGGAISLGATVSAAYAYFKAQNKWYKI